MSEITSIANELRAIHDGNAWHGASLHDALDGVIADQAAARPIADAHSIWEIVHHIAGWENIWLRRFAGDPDASEPEEGDFAPVVEISEAVWQSTLTRLNDIHAKLIETVSVLTDEQLRSDLPGRDYTHRFLLRAAIRHHVYHTGQIALLRKAFLS
ncbi:MAG: DinB family protein [Pyrinomonadaceae bacterium]